MKSKKLILVKKSSPLVFRILSTILILKTPLGYILKNTSGFDLLFQNGQVYFFSKTNKNAYVSIIKNLAKGLLSGYYVKLNFKGLGYRFIFLKNRILFKLGYTHFIEYSFNKSDISITGFKNKLYIYSISLEHINNLIRIFKKIKPFNNYTEKGIFIENEIVLLKVGKER